MKQYTLTLVGFVIALAISLITIFLDIDLFEQLIEGIESVEHIELDEFIIPFGVFALFAFLDQFRKLRSDHIELEKIKIYEVMMASTHHVMNNCLNQVLLFKITAENTPGFDAEILELHDIMIKEVKAQIASLGNIARIDEAAIHAAVAPTPTS